jgi:hypothetical protein
MTKIIYTSFSTSLFELHTDQKTIEEIIQIIRSDKYENLTKRIRATKEKTARTELKKNLPVFYPSIVLDENVKSVEMKLDNSIPSGVIQFDIDIKDNEDLDVESLKSEIIQLPECIYAFLSPYGGLKFGIMTDFSRPENTSNANMKVRFKHAYLHCLDLLEEVCTSPFIADSSLESIQQACYLSHDPEAYFNNECAVLPIIDFCEIDENSYEFENSSDETANSWDEAQIQLALVHIPKNLKYHDRTKVNLCVLYMLGASGIAILKMHWEKSDSQKLSKQLSDCLKGARFGSIPLLWSLAIEHGYRAENGPQRTNLKAESTDLVLKALSTQNEAMDQLTAIVRDFFENKQSHFVNVTAGAGKTRIVLEALADAILWNTKVLFLVPTYKLGREIAQSHQDIKKTNADNAVVLKDKFKGGNITILQGREVLCMNKNLMKKYSDIKLSLPLAECMHGCHFRANCDYINQFNNPLSSIRVMTHSEWVNQQSMWFHGKVQDGNGERDEEVFKPNPNKDSWIPEFIIIDENIINVARTPLKELVTSKHNSIKLIIDDFRRDIPFEEAVFNNRQQIIINSGSNYRVQPVKFIDSESFIQIMKKNKAENTFSEILYRLKMYCQSGDIIFLNGMWIENDAINLSEVKLAADRYMAIPTLFLDATANETVVKKLFPDINFHRVTVKSKDDINLFQMQNKPFTKKFLDDSNNQRVVIDGLKIIVEKYKNVGLITYKTLDSDGELEFHKMLANAIGVEKVMYFGNLRGINDMEDVDCLLIVGRYLLPMDANVTYAHAVFNHSEKLISKNADLPIRMKDGTVRKLNTFIANDSFHQAIYEHFSLSETLQAIGRARRVHGCKKDIYVFANTNLGIDTEVTDFFSYHDYFDKPLKPRKPENVLIHGSVIEHIKNRGYLQDIQGEFQAQLQLSLSQIKTKRSVIAAELEMNGMIKSSFKGRYANGTQWTRRYYIFGSTEKLEHALLTKNESLITEKKD